MFRISIRTARATHITAAAALALAALTGIAPASASPSRAHHLALASVKGSARIMYAYSPKDDIRFTIDAQAAPYTHRFPGTRLENGLPTDAEGTVLVSHHSAEKNATFTAEARVDCLATGGPVATLTAVVTKSAVLTVGQRIGLSVYQGSGDDEDGGGARLGFSWGIGNADVDASGKPYQPVVGTCMAPAPFAPVVHGGYQVHHADIEVR
ncbi:hypothetical protein [Kitasatospora sp. NPDC101183]|uniref:hypothetical protein n=1 Tax=Kitasatospora sp. NPDC101183 TaxID=3364100 RepID=UPI00381E2A6A